MAHNVLTIKNAEVKLTNTRTGTPTFTAFGDAIDEVTLQITSTVTQWKPVTGNTQQDVTAPEYSVVLNLGQDFAATSLWMYLLSNHGKKGKIEITPQGGTAPKIAADITIVHPSQAGGKAGEVATAGATLPVDGAAVITAAP